MAYYSRERDSQTPDLPPNVDGTSRDVQAATRSGRHDWPLSWAFPKLPIGALKNFEAASPLRSNTIVPSSIITSFCTNPPFILFFNRRILVSIIRLFHNVRRF